MPHENTQTIEPFPSSYQSSPHIVCTFFSRVGTWYQQVVYGLGIEYLVLEYADEGSLEDWLARDKEMPTEQCADIFKQLCLALGYLHDREIAHRDVKPANMFMCRGNVVKLGDFGFAASIHDAELGKVVKTFIPSYAHSANTI